MQVVYVIGNTPILPPAKLKQAIRMLGCQIPLPLSRRKLHADLFDHICVDQSHGKLSSPMIDPVYFYCFPRREKQLVRDHCSNLFVLGLFFNQLIERQQLQ